MPMKDADISEIEHDLSESNIIFIHSMVDDAGLSLAAFRVYSHLARRTLNSRRDIWPGADSIARVCGINKKTVWRALKELIDRGMIVREARKGQTSRHVLTSPSTWLPKRVDPKETPGIEMGHHLTQKEPHHLTQKEPHEGTPIKDIHERLLQPGVEHMAPVEVSAPAAGESHDEHLGRANGVEKKQARPRNLPFDALARLDGIGEGRRGTRREMGRVGLALKEIKDVCPEVTAEEIEGRAAKWIRLFPRAVITSTALAANWNRCAWEELGLGLGSKWDLPKGCEWRAIGARLGMRIGCDVEWGEIGHRDKELILTEWERTQQTETEQTENAK